MPPPPPGSHILHRSILDFFKKNLHFIVGFTRNYDNIMSSSPCIIFPNNFLHQNNKIYIEKKIIIQSEITRHRALIVGM